MRLHVFAVLDKAVGAYLPPFYARAKGEALRQFSDACNKEDHQFALHAADYILVHLGEFDDSTGLYHCGEPQRVISALEVRVDDPFTSDKEVGAQVDRPRRLPM